MCVKEYFVHKQKKTLYDYQLKQISSLTFNKIILIHFMFL